MRVLGTWLGTGSHSSIFTLSTTCVEDAPLYEGGGMSGGGGSSSGGGGSGGGGGGRWLEEALELKDLRRSSTEDRIDSCVVSRASAEFDALG